MKDIADTNEKIRKIQGSFSVSNPEIILGQTVIVLDDTIGSGETMRELCRVLKGAGATCVVGLACAKNLADR